MTHQNTIQVLARALIVMEGYVLLAHGKGTKSTFLPGGHVEFGESLPVTLSRELAEELGLSADVGRYLGAVEHKWERAGLSQHEINHVFCVNVPALKSGRDPDSLEGHIDFHWTKLNELMAHRLLPSPMNQLIDRFVGGNTDGYFASTFND